MDENLASDDRNDFQLITYTDVILTPSKNWDGQGMLGTST